MIVPAASRSSETSDKTPSLLVKRAAWDMTECRRGSMGTISQSQLVCRRAFTSRDAGGKTHFTPELRKKSRDSRTLEALRASPIAVGTRPSRSSRAAKHRASH